MLDYIWLIPLFPLISATVLILSTGKMSKTLATIFGVGSIGLSAWCVLLTVIVVLNQGSPALLKLWSWIHIGNFAPGFAFYIDGLTLVMMSVITGVGFLIHLYSSEFMAEDDDFCRYFAYMNLFVSAMLILVMADNLLLLYLGWEGVGVCSYLLVGFWYRDPANGAAARKAFVVTRVGDTAMALGLFLLFVELGTLNIQELAIAANIHWLQGSTLPTLATALLLGGAVGKSAQLPLQTWLPDAMAGPTPVSALIHAATMVTAGVYLIARTHELFLLAPAVLTAVAVVGLATSLMAAFTAINQNDIKRILAYSTISQIGYMFLALGVGAWTAGIFHLMTHAFFKALLFLGAGAVIHCLHHEHNIFKMGGLRTRLPVVFWSFVIGSAALAALPFTSGFYSKDQILLSAWLLPDIGHWLWAGGLLGALLTSTYSFRLVFIVFYGDANTEPDRQLGWKMSTPLIALCVLSIIGGWFSLPLDNIFPDQLDPHSAGYTIEWISIAVPIVGVGLAYLIFLGKQISVGRVVKSKMGMALVNFWQGGWGMDTFYDLIWVKPYYALSGALRNEPVDMIYHTVVNLIQAMHSWLGSLQVGKIRWYACGIIFGVVILLALLIGVQP